MYPLILADLAGSTCPSCYRSVNAVAESFFSSLKKERIGKRIYRTRDLARTGIFDYIESFTIEPVAIVTWDRSAPRRLNAPQCGAGICLSLRGSPNSTL